MPYKSMAQSMAMHAKAVRGEIDPAVVKEWDAMTDWKKIPTHVKQAAMARKKR